jgi:hypothetical protein
VNTIELDRNSIYQFAEFKSIKHLEVAACLTPLEVRDILPEAINTGQGHEPLRVQFPGVPTQYTHIYFI